MTEKVEKRRATLINIIYFAVIIMIVYCFIKYFFWITAPFLLSFVFAVILQKPLRRIDKKFNKKHHTLWSVLLVLFSICIVLIPVILILSTLVKEIGNFITYIIGQLDDLPTFLAMLETKILDLLTFLPDGIYTGVSEKITTWFSALISDFGVSNLGINLETITSGLSTGISGVYSVVKNVPSAILGIVIGIIAWIFFTKDYDYIVSFIRAQFPADKKNLLSEIKKVFSTTVLKMLRAYGIIMFITFCELMIGFSILSIIGVLHNSYILIIAIAIAIFDILPVAGSGGILIPWALISLVSGNFGQAVGLLVMYIIITVIRQYIEPKIMGDSLGVHPLVTLAGLYFGLKLFSVLGMFIVPITVMTLKALNDTGRIQIWKALRRN